MNLIKSMVREIKVKSAFLIFVNGSWVAFLTNNSEIYGDFMAVETETLKICSGEVYDVSDRNFSLNID